MATRVAHVTTARDFSLSRQPPRCSVSDMRVEHQVENAAPSNRKVFPPAHGYVNLRKNPLAVQQIAVADANPPLGRFLEIINGPESLFASFDATAGETPGASEAAAAAGFGSSVTLVFADPTLNHDRDRYEQLAVQLSGLLLRESAEALTCALGIAGCEFTPESKTGYCLGSTLMARAESAEQARVRWGLGLARVQQALLYCSRQMRLKLRQAE